jgi:hypothetical protein
MAIHRVDYDAQPPKMKGVIDQRRTARASGFRALQPHGSDYQLVSKVEWVAQGVRDGDDYSTYCRKSRWAHGQTQNPIIDQLVKERLDVLPDYLKPPVMEADVLQALIDAGIDAEPYFTSGKFSRPEEVQVA